ncbi:cyclodeaminase/cyclohydrolase family protein [Candidatus Omnitrophota bacterium]
MRYVDKNIKYFANKLAAKAPTPGGGSAAALSAYIGCSLLSMVANYTLARKGFNGYKDRAKRVQKGSEKLRQTFAELIDKDVEAYESLSKAFIKYKDNTAKLQPALKRAVGPLAKICIHAHRAGILCLDLSYVGNKYLMSDLCTSIYLLDAALESSMIIIKSNLAYMKDKSYIINKKQQYVYLQQDMKRIKAEVLAKAKERMLI